MAVLGVRLRPATPVLLREQTLHRVEHGSAVVCVEQVHPAERMHVGIVHQVGVEEEEELPAPVRVEPAERLLEFLAVAVPVEALVEAARAVHLSAAREGDGRVAGVLQDLRERVDRGAQHVRGLVVPPELDAMHARVE